jgi:LacI family transcriptional regulator
LTTVEHRVAGFVESLTRAGIPSSQVEVIEGEFSEDGGYAVGRRIAAAPREATALFCVSDVMAIGALTALHEFDVAVPDELSVIGFDDIPVVRHLRPALSTAHLDLEGMGRAAMELVLAPEVQEERRVRFAAQVVLRDSTAPPPSR